jgi:hypothetical protein
MSSAEFLADGFSIPDQRADYWAQAADRGSGMGRRRGAGGGRNISCIEAAATRSVGGNPAAGGLFRISRAAVDASAATAFAQRGCGRFLCAGAAHQQRDWRPARIGTMRRCGSRARKWIAPLSEFLPPPLDGHRDSYRPYFEVLAVAAMDPSHAERNRQRAAAPAPRRRSLCLRSAACRQFRGRHPGRRWRTPTCSPSSSATASGSARGTRPPALRDALARADAP